ncbi:MAG TPA: VOC family protein [Baekduia sp.]|nr:VOC family protein [Baekduia sp.]
MPKITPNLWFDTQAQEAAEYYVSVFPNSRVVSILNYNEAVPDKAGTPVTVTFDLDGTRFVGINGGPQFTFDEAVSFSIDCADQDEIDYYWDRFVADGGEEGPCGWVKDKYGLSWQVVPAGVEELFADPVRGTRAMAAMMKMRKLDIAELQRAADGAPATH